MISDEQIAILTERTLLFGKPDAHMIRALVTRLRSAEDVLKRIATELYPAEYYQRFAGEYLDAINQTNGEG